MNWIVLEIVTSVFILKSHSKQPKKIICNTARAFKLLNLHKPDKHNKKCGITKNTNEPKGWKKYVKYKNAIEKNPYLAGKVCTFIIEM